MSLLGNELPETARYIVSRLSGDSALSILAPGGVWAGVADLGVATPYIVFTLMASPDTRGSASYRNFTRPLYLIEALAPVEGYGGVASAADRMDQLIGLARNGSTDILNVASVYREQATERYEVDSGARWVRLGGFYRFIVYKANYNIMRRVPQTANVS